MIERIDKMLASMIDRIDNLMDRLWLWKMKAYLFVAQKLYDKIMAMVQEIEGADL